MPTYPEFDAIIKDCDKNCIVKFLKTIFPGETRKGKVVGKFGGAEQKTRIDGLNILGSVTLETSDGRSKPIICCAKQMDGVLSERSSRRKQFDDSVTVLKEVFVKPYVGNGSVEGAFTQGLFFFFDDKGNFRLSLVTSEIVNGKQELNNYRRQSFFVEAGARNNTFRTRICKKIAAYEDLKSAFDVEKLSDDFFREYKVFYEDIVQYVTGARYIEVKKNKYERTEMSAPNSAIFDQFTKAYGDDAEKAVRNYVKKLMGRLVFIQFLQKKGWLGIPMGTDGWKGGDKDFLQHLFDHVSPEEQNSFVDKVLEEVLFYSFNRKESERKLKNSTLKKFKFPFLNCGLFDKDRDDDFDFALPGAVFHNKKFYDTERKAPDIKSWIKKRKPYFNDEVCGLFDFFDRFNFTIDENDPTDADVSVDPEMLGKIFENLLEDNKDKGAFYTPKEIVGYMCNESLIAYLESECPSLCHPERSASEVEGSRIRSLVVDLNADSFTEKEKETLDQKLSEVKICDPAIGSGAFPMGLLNLLYKTRLKLGVVQKNSKNPEATLKREIIQQNIYGVDIEKGAVDIAQLRFWLSLVVDEVEPDALPNLEYKIMQGNSLLESYEGIDLSSLAGEKKDRSRGKASDQMSLVFDEKQAMEQIQRDLNSFYKTDDYNVKEHLKKDINLNVKNYIKHIAPEKSKAIDALPLPNDKFFLWHTYFRDVFDRKGKCGFDIVIGNPPYLLCQPSNTDEKLLDYYRTHFEVASYKVDLFHLFFEGGVDLLRKNGILSFITPNTYLTNKYIKPLRQFILENCDVLRLVLHDKVFESAQVDNATIVLKSGKEKQHRVVIEKCENFKFKNFDLLEQSQWENDADFVFNVQKEFSIETQLKLGDIASVTFGLQTADKKTYVKESPMGAGWEACYTGRDISRYYLPNPSLYFLNEPLKVKAGGSWNMKIHHASKIVTRQIGAPEPIFALDEIGVATLNTMYSILVENKSYSEKFILGLCCSNLIKFWWLSKFSDNKALFPKIKGFQLKEIPIPKTSPIQQQSIIALVDFIIAAKKKDPTADTSKQEAEIDKLVYELYGLTDEEIAIVEGTSATTSAAKPNKSSASSQTTSISADWLQGEDL
ncbi:TaqI-like C-terminal specificity domain-containing protein [Fibrobacter sp. UWEL]|uniref:Eco57I restriction-modification methylase domain-containing protein n=1 Tax=Fibrobacter sp. UWEL TaxID=1896209 RepID=UPI00091638FC|nr:TaqI-like C-terminal specificity domain-containing protein [Fibrobacter sp. UWEL]SHK79458.1 Eco57I restriction-modification methylase [Fibrobacter sp. UWEL]